jgi:hypothetical protein
MRGEMAKKCFDFRPVPLTLWLVGDSPLHSLIKGQRT